RRNFVASCHEIHAEDGVLPSVFTPVFARRLHRRRRWSPCGRRGRHTVCYRLAWLTSDLVMNARAHSAALVSTEANPRDEAGVSLFDRQSYCLGGQPRVSRWTAPSVLDERPRD